MFADAVGLISTARTGRCVVSMIHPPWLGKRGGGRPDLTWGIADGSTAVSLLAHIMCPIRKIASEFA
jgi:hypothetical protein